MKLKLISRGERGLILVNAETGEQVENATNIKYVCDNGKPEATVTFQRVALDAEEKAVEEVKA